MAPGDNLAHLLKLIDRQRTTQARILELQLELESLQSRHAKDTVSVEVLLRRLVVLTDNALSEPVCESARQLGFALALWEPSLLGSLAGQRATLTLMAQGLAKSADATHSGERNPLKAGVSLAGALLEALLEHTATERRFLELLLEDVLPADTVTRRFARSVVV